MQDTNFGRLNIILAIYGLKDVTEKIQHLVTNSQPETLSFTVANEVIGDDGWKGQEKSLLILYNYDGGDMQISTSKERDTISINADKFKQIRLINTTDSTNDKLSVIAASYGPDDVTYKIKNLISSYNTLSFKVSNEIFGDTWYGVPKTLIIILGRNDKIEAIEIFTEREDCYIDLNEVVPAI